MNFFGTKKKANAKEKEAEKEKKDGDNKEEEGKDDDDDGTLPIAIEEKGIDFIMDSLRENQATIIISFIIGAVSCPAPRVHPIPLRLTAALALRCSASCWRRHVTCSTRTG